MERFRLRVRHEPRRGTSGNSIYFLSIPAVSSGKRKGCALRRHSRAKGLTALRPHSGARAESSVLPRPLKPYSGSARLPSLSCSGPKHQSLSLPRNLGLRLSRAGSGQKTGCAWR